MGADVANGSVEMSGFSKDLHDGVHVNNISENGSVNPKKSREIERRRRRRKQKKKNRAANGTQFDNDSDGEGPEHEPDKENNKFAEQVEVEYISEKSLLEDDIIEDFKRVFEKFTFGDAMATAKKDEGNPLGQKKNSKGYRKADKDEMVRSNAAIGHHSRDVVHHGEQSVPHLQSRPWQAQAC